MSNKDVHDTLVCGNCGYDGGRKHLQEKLEWEKTFAGATKESGDTKTHRYTAMSITVMAVACVAALTVWGVWPEPVLSPEATRHQEVAEMYEQCTQTVRFVEREAQPGALSSCNNSFKVYLDSGGQIIPPTMVQ